MTLQTSSPPLSATICAVLAEGFPALNPARPCWALSRKRWSKGPLQYHRDSPHRWMKHGAQNRPKEHPLTVSLDEERIGNGWRPERAERTAGVTFQLSSIFDITDHRLRRKASKRSGLLVWLGSLLVTPSKKSSKTNRMLPLTRCRWLTANWLRSSLPIARFFIFENSFNETHTRIIQLIIARMEPT